MDGLRRAGGAGAGAGRGGSAAAVAMEGMTPPQHRRRRLGGEPQQLPSQQQHGGRIREAARGRSTTRRRRPLRCGEPAAEGGSMVGRPWRAEEEEAQDCGRRRQGARAAEAAPAGPAAYLLGRGRLWASLSLVAAAVALCSASLPAAHAFMAGRPSAAPRAAAPLTRRPALSKLSPAGAVISQPKPTSSSGPATAADQPMGMGAHTHGHAHTGGHAHAVGHQSHTAHAHAALSPTASAAAVVGAEPATITRAVAATSAAAAASPPETPGAPSLLWGSATAAVSAPAAQPAEPGLVITPPAGGVELPIDETRREQLLREAYQECQRITSIYAKTFYMGTSFLDYDKRSATWAIYVWCRRTDDIVDSPRAIVEKTMDADLESWNRRLDDIWDNKPWDALDATLCDVRARYPTMSIEPYRDMIKGMVMDVPGIGQARYETFEDLYLYCYRVAGTVGLMTLPIMGTAPGYTEKQATEPALALGIALQLTNILRDVGEDALRGRIYLPLEDLERFGVTEDQIMNKIMNSNYRELIKFEIARARKYFDRAEEGIKMLSPDARLPVRSSLDMYRKILDVIEENDYDNFRKRAYVGKFEKLLTLPYSWLKTLSG